MRLRLNHDRLAEHGCSIHVEEDNDVILDFSFEGPTPFTKDYSKYVENCFGSQVMDRIAEVVMEETAKVIVTNALD